MHAVTVNGEIKYAKNGTVLSDFLKETGESVSHLCGGNGICKKCLVTVDGTKTLSCRYKIEKDITVEFEKEEKKLSYREETSNITENLCFVLDIGTTTLAMALVSLDEKKIVKVITRTNSQITFGADVISRIEYCDKHSVTKLHEAVINDINSMLSEFNVTNAIKMYVAGNTVMLHILFAVDCASLGIAPYTPSFLESKAINGKDIGLSYVETVESLPCISSFVGADIVSGLNFVKEPQNGKYSMLVDLGTNAETVLFSNESVICTSAAAGPCFEGAEISCGMSATYGAIYRYEKNNLMTVGNSAAKGICGTGLIDIVAVLVSDGIVSETGFMECEKYCITDTVYVSREDIRRFQLAKSAVCSAILTLLVIKNVSFDEIENVYLSGGFSAEINVDNAAVTGLIPKELKEKCISVNNSSLLGAVKYACEKNNLSKLKADYVDLAVEPIFSQLFIENMMFDI